MMLSPRRWISETRKRHAGRVAPDRLVERVRVSKPLGAYTRDTRTVAALERARDQGIAVHPGQDVAYVVVDDAKHSRERVALAHESVDTYDAAYYETQLVRAVESVLAPLGWDRDDINRELAETADASLSAFAGRQDS